MKKIKNLLKGGKLDGILISSVPNIIYFLGYSGFSEVEREAYLLILDNESFLITDGRYSEALKNIKGFTLLERSPDKKALDIFKELSKKYRVKKIGFEENDLRVSEFNSFSEVFSLIPSDISDLRALKNPSEIKLLQEACSIGDEVYSQILRDLKIGIEEKELAFEIEILIKKKGAEPSFPSIVAFGPDSSIPHHQTGNRKLKANEIVLLDFGVKTQNFCSDMTRTVFFGKADEKFKKMYQTVLVAQDKAFRKLSETNRASEIDKTARDYITSQGYPMIPHSIGHGVGIEVHEPPRLSPTSGDKLKNGMVFSLEPGIYESGYGGVRIEDLVVLENNKPRFLSLSPRNLIEL